MDTEASDSQSDQDNGLVNCDSRHRRVKDSCNYDDLQFIGESSSIDETNLVKPLSDSESDLDAVASNSQSDHENELAKGGSHHRDAKDSSKLDDLQFCDDSSSIDESNLLDNTSDSEYEVDTAASDTQSEKENGLVNGDSYHRGAKGSSDYDDLLLWDESSSIEESNLVDTANDLECNQENGLVNENSPAYCDLQISGQSSSAKGYNSDSSEASYSSHNQDIIIRS